LRGFLSGHSFCRFHYDVKEESIETTHADLSLHELEVTVVKATDLPFAPDSTKLTYRIIFNHFKSPMLIFIFLSYRFYASAEFGYPDSNTPQTFATDQVTVNGPPFNPSTPFGLSYIHFAAFLLIYSLQRSTLRASSALNGKRPYFASSRREK